MIQRDLTIINRLGLHARAIEQAGEAVKVFIVKKDPNLTEQAVRDYCEKNLAGYKKPKYIVFRADLPKTPVGKILRRELRDMDKKTA